MLRIVHFNSLFWHISSVNRTNVSYTKLCCTLHVKYILMQFIVPNYSIISSSFFCLFQCKKQEYKFSFKIGTLSHQITRYVCGYWVVFYLLCTSHLQPCPSRPFSPPNKSNIVQKWAIKRLQNVSLSPSLCCSALNILNIPY